MSLTVIIPSFKESDNIAKLSSSIVDSIPNSNILVVDDTPDTSCVDAIKSLNNKNIKIVHRAAKKGRGSAVILGIKKSLKNKSHFYLEMDADYSHPFEQIPELIEKMKNDQADMVIASRYLPSSQIINWPQKRKWFSSFSNKLAFLLLRVPVSDYTNGFRLYSPQAATEIVRTCDRGSKGFIALSEILVNLHYRGFKIVEVPTVFTNRLRGESSLTIKEITNAASGLFRIFFKISKIKKEALKMTSHVAMDQ